MVLERLIEWNKLFNVEELIVNFEIKIHKSIDEILPNVALLGFFFHFAKVSKTKLGKRKMKKYYDTNHEFCQLIKIAISLKGSYHQDFF